MLRLPADCGVGLTTGAQMANVTGLAAARHALLARAGWDVEEQGMFGAPPLRVLAGEEAHVTLWRALRLLGFGRADVEVVPVDDQGAMRADALAEALRRARARRSCARRRATSTPARSTRWPTIAAAAREHGAWVHVDGAFGLWAAASPPLAHLVEGHAECDSWATDAHKWLNVPYDCGVVAVRDAAAHAAAMGMSAAYLAAGRARARTPTGRPRPRGAAAASRSTRRCARSAARAWPSWSSACCALARRLASRVEGEVEVLNDVVLNQVLLAFGRRDASSATLQAEGTLWAGGTRLARPRRRCASRSPTGRPPRPTSTAARRRSSWPRGRRRGQRRIEAILVATREAARSTAH